jgi:ABC-type bacteriocin/lantibiotic exporter with double-glycine peptidase domain
MVTLGLVMAAGILAGDTISGLLAWRCGLGVRCLAEDIASARHPRRQCADDVPSNSAGPAIRAEDLSYRYTGVEHPRLRNLAVEAQSGEVLLVTGPSGSGKSTLIDVLLGLRSPTAGRVERTGCDGSATCSDVRRAGLAIPGADVLPGTVLDNILAHRDGLSLEDARRAAASLDIDCIIAALPRRYETPISEAMRLLPADVSEVIPVARALAARPHALAIDALDGFSHGAQTRIQNALLSYEGACIVAMTSAPDPRLRGRILRLTGQEGDDAREQVGIA